MFCQFVFLSFLHFGVFFFVVVAVVMKNCGSVRILAPYWHRFPWMSPFSLLCPLWLRLVKCWVFVLQRGRLWFANENSYMCPGLPFCCKLAAHCWRAAGTCNAKSFHVMNSLGLSSGSKARTEEWNTSKLSHSCTQKLREKILSYSQCFRTTCNIYLDVLIMD